MSQPEPSFFDSESIQSSGKSEKDVTSFVKYLLQGSGAEEKIDFQALRKELEQVDEQPSTFIHSPYSSSQNYNDTASQQYNSSPKYNQNASYTQTPTSYSQLKHDTPPLSESTPDNYQKNQLEKRMCNEAILDAALETVNNFHKQFRDQLDDAESQVSSHLSFPTQSNPSFPVLGANSLDIPNSPIQPNKIISTDLTQISEKLITAGFPPLHPALLFAQESDQTTLSSRQIIALAHTFDIIINEYSRRGEMIQTLINRVSEAEERSHHWQSKITDTIKKSQTSLVDPNELVYVKQQLSLANERIELLESNLNHSTNVKSSPENNHNKNNNNNVISGLIKVYEGKVNQLENEIKQLKQTSTLNQPPILPDPLSEYQTQQHSINLLKQSLQTQLTVLNSRLVEKQDVIKSLENQIELMNLKLLNQKGLKRGNSGVNTRDLIKNDKRVWQFNIDSIDRLTIDECRDLLKAVCVKLEIKSAESLIASLTELDKIVRLLPQIQNFIEQVNELLWQNETQYTKQHQIVPHLLTKTLEKLQDKLVLLDTLPMLQDFKDAVYSLFNVSLNESESIVIKLIKSKFDQTTTTQSNDDQKINPTNTFNDDVPSLLSNQFIKQFKDLFEINQNAELVTRLNQLYIFHIEIINLSKLFIKFYGFNDMMEVVDVFQKVYEKIQCDVDVERNENNQMNQGNQVNQVV